MPNILVILLHILDALTPHDAMAKSFRAPTCKFFPITHYNLVKTVWKDIVFTTLTSTVILTICKENNVEGVLPSKSSAPLLTPQ